MPDLEEVTGQGLICNVDEPITVTHTAEVIAKHTGWKRERLVTVQELQKEAMRHILPRWAWIALRSSHKRSQRHPRTPGARSIRVRPRARAFRCTRRRSSSVSSDSSSPALERHRGSHTCHQGRWQR